MPLQYTHRSEVIPASRRRILGSGSPGRGTTRYKEAGPGRRVVTTGAGQQTPGLARKAGTPTDPDIGTGAGMCAGAILP